MPNKLEQPESLFDFSEAFDPPLFDFSGLFDSSGADSLPGENEDDPRKRIRRALEDSGMVYGNTDLSRRPVYGASSPSTLANAGLPDDVPPEEGGLALFIKKFNEVTADPLIRRTGLAPLVGALSGGAEVATKALKPYEYDKKQGAGETATELSLNANRSFFRGAAALAYLPEAMARDPLGVVKGMVEFIPDQAALLWDATMPAKTREDRLEQKEARRILYEDPLGPFFAAFLAGGLAKIGKAGATVLSEHAAKYRINKGFQKNLDLARKVAGEMNGEFINQVSDAESASFRGPAPPISTGKLPPGISGLLPDYNQQAVPVTPKPTGRRVPPAAGLEQDFGAIARPIGEADLFLDVPSQSRSLGTAPPGNFMQFIARLRYEAKKGHTETLSTEALSDPGLVAKLPGIEKGPQIPRGAMSEAEILAAQENIKPPKYRPFLENGDDFEGQGLQEAVNLVDDIPDGSLENFDVQAMLKNRRSRLSGLFGFMQHKNRVTLPESKSLVNRFADMFRLQERHLGNWSEDARLAGTLTQREGIIPALRRAAKGQKEMSMSEFMALPKVRGLFVNVYEKLRAAGVQTIMPDGTARPIEMNLDFLEKGPARLKADVAKQIWKDVSGIDQTAKVAAGEMGWGKDSKYIENLIDNMQKDAMIFSETTERAISHLMGDNPKGIRYAKTRGQALKFLAEQTSENLFRRHGVERPRLAHYFPEEYFETNPAKLVGMYLNEASRTLAEVETFGPAREGLNNALMAIQKKNLAEYQFMSEMSDMAMGVIDKTRPISGTAEAVQRWYANVTYGVKIGAGFSPIVQVSQPLISLADAPFSTQFRAAVNIMAPRERSFLRRFGVTGDGAYRRFMGYGTNSRVWDYIPGTQVHKYLNRALDYMAAETGLLLAKDLHRLANRDVSQLSWRRSAAFEKQVQYARTKLKEDFGIDYTKPFGENEFVRATRDYASRTQHHPDVLIEPKFMNMPNTRWLATLKRFSYKQALLFKDMTWKEWKRGNVMPSLRLAAGGYFGGGVMLEAKRKLREAMSGKHVFREHEDFWVDLGNRMAVMGTAGGITDLSAIRGDDPVDLLKSVGQNLEFGAMPVAVSDAGRVATALGSGVLNLAKSQWGTEAQQKSMTTEEVARLFAEDMAVVLGSYGYWMSGRTQSDSTESKKNKEMYDRQLRHARSAYWSRDYDRARAIMREWNEFNDDYEVDGLPIGMDWNDISDPSMKKSFK